MIWCMLRNFCATCGQDLALFENFGLVNLNTSGGTRHRSTPYGVSLGADGVIDLLASLVN